MSVVLLQRAFFITLHLHGLSHLSIIVKSDICLPPSAITVLLTSSYRGKSRDSMLYHIDTPLRLAIQSQMLPNGTSLFYIYNAALLQLNPHNSSQIAYLLTILPACYHS